MAVFTNPCRKSGLPARTRYHCSENPFGGKSKIAVGLKEEMIMRRLGTVRNRRTRIIKAAPKERKR
jgi:hypothetical protein